VIKKLVFDKHYFLMHAEEVDFVGELKKAGYKIEAVPSISCLS